MQSVNVSGILVENAIIRSEYLEREVKLSFFLPKTEKDPAGLSLLLINDGQNMEELGLESILSQLYLENSIRPLLCVGIHTHKDRKIEYGVAGMPDYLGRGNKADKYTSFVMKELIPYINVTYGVDSFREKAFAGFSLGGLMALDIIWNHPDEFSTAGVFSGSLWWRNIDQDSEDYSDDKHRIMHQQIRNRPYHPGLRFFFQCGNMDETKDRNKNGIIDSIDDTVDLVNELVTKGYSREKDIYYLEMPDGRHDISTWARAMPVFLKWAWATKTKVE